MEQTLDYYDKNAEAYAESTAHVDFSEIQERFLRRLPEGALILDFGCGSGRDSKYFLSRGFRVQAVDGSVKLCRLASEATGLSVKRMLFTELSGEEIYDGIWACSSILHLPWEELRDVLGRAERALKEGGSLYTSFKYGTFEGVRDGRYFCDMTEERFETLRREVSGLETEECWVSRDVRPRRGEERWLNLIMRKKIAGR